jgi:RNA polymerase sigma-54 factor
MTPQLQQAIRLLQLSTLDLQTEIQEALESNPLLEMEETRTEAGDAENNSETETTSSAGDDFTDLIDFSKNTDYTSTADTPTTQNADEVSVNLEGKEMPDELPVDSDWDTLFDGVAGASGSSSGDDDDYDFESRNSAPESIYDNLLWQLNLTHMSDMDRMIAMAIIEAIDTKGYLTQTAEEIRDCVLAQHDIVADIVALQQQELEAMGVQLQPEEGDDGTAISLEEVIAVLHRIQQFDPPGVAARDLRECLLIQLRQLPKSPDREDAILLVDQFLEALGSRDFTLIMRKSRLTETRLKAAIALVQTLNPYPGSSVEADETQYVVPDVIVRKDKGRWRVELNPEATPRLRVNSSYASLIQRADNSSDNTFLKNNLQEARWFIKSLQSRNETLLKVATKIVEHQIGFLEHGEEAMKPLVLHDIAEAVSMHESTISRVTTQKYMHTPKGVFELKYFFSSHVSTGSGGECSSTAIRAIIKKLISAENPRKPLSDSKIADILAEQDIQVARRTIAKYREAMLIPPSNERKRLV